jgi:hypothetical protein
MRTIGRISRTLVTIVCALVALAALAVALSGAQAAGASALPPDGQSAPAGPDSGGGAFTWPAAGQEPVPLRTLPATVNTGASAGAPGQGIYQVYALFDRANTEIVTLADGTREFKAIGPGPSFLKWGITSHRDIKDRYSNGRLDSDVPEYRDISGRLINPKIVGEDTTVAMVFVADGLTEARAKALERTLQSAFGGPANVERYYNDQAADVHTGKPGKDWQIVSAAKAAGFYGGSTGFADWVNAADPATGHGLAWALETLTSQSWADIKQHVMMNWLLMVRPRPPGTPGGRYVVRFVQDPNQQVVHRVALPGYFDDPSTPQAGQGDASPAHVTGTKPDQLEPVIMDRLDHLRGFDPRTRIEVTASLGGLLNATRAANPALFTPGQGGLLSDRQVNDILDHVMAGRVSEVRDAITAALQRLPGITIAPADARELARRLAHEAAGMTGTPAAVAARTAGLVTTAIRPEWLSRVRADTAPVLARTEIIAQFRQLSDPVQAAGWADQALWQLRPVVAQLTGGDQAQASDVVTQLRGMLERIYAASPSRALTSGFGAPAVRKLTKDLMTARRDEIARLLQPQLQAKLAARGASATAGDLTSIAAGLAQAASGHPGTTQDIAGRLSELAADAMAPADGSAGTLKVRALVARVMAKLGARPGQSRPAPGAPGGPPEYATPIENGTFQLGDVAIDGSGRPVDRTELLHSLPPGTVPLDKSEWNYLLRLVDEQIAPGGGGEDRTQPQPEYGIVYIPGTTPGSLGTVQVVKGGASLDTPSGVRVLLHTQSQARPSAGDIIALRRTVFKYEYLLVHPEGGPPELIIYDRFGNFENIDLNPASRAPQIVRLADMNAPYSNVWYDAHTAAAGASERLKDARQFLTHAIGQLSDMGTRGTPARPKVVTPLIAAAVRAAAQNGLGNTRHLRRLQNQFPPGRELTSGQRAVLSGALNTALAAATAAQSAQPSAAPVLATGLEQASDALSYLTSLLAPTTTSGQALAALPWFIRDAIEEDRKALADGKIPRYYPIFAQHIAGSLEQAAGRLQGTPADKAGAVLRQGSSLDSALEAQLDGRATASQWRLLDDARKALTSWHELLNQVAAGHAHLPPSAAPAPAELPASRHSPGGAAGTAANGAAAPAPAGPATQTSSGPVSRDPIDLDATRREHLLQQLRSYGWLWATSPSSGMLGRLTTEQLDRLLKLVEQQRQIDQQMSEMTRQKQTGSGTADPQRQEELQRQHDDLQRQIDELLRQGTRHLVVPDDHGGSAPAGTPAAQPGTAGGHCPAPGTNTSAICTTDPPANGDTQCPANPGTNTSPICGTDPPANGDTQCPAMPGTNTSAICGTDPPANGDTQCPANPGTNTSPICGTDPPANGDTQCPAMPGTNTSPICGTDPPANGDTQCPANPGTNTSPICGTDQGTGILSADQGSQAASQDGTVAAAAQATPGDTVDPQVTLDVTSPQTNTSQVSAGNGAGGLSTDGVPAAISVPGTAPDNGTTQSTCGSPGSCGQLAPIDMSTAGDSGNQNPPDSTTSSAPATAGNDGTSNTGTPLSSVLAAQSSSAQSSSAQADTTVQIPPLDAQALQTTVNNGDSGNQNPPDSTISSALATAGNDSASNSGTALTSGGSIQTLVPTVSSLPITNP